MTNRELSERLRAHAAELERQGGQLFRVRAYRAAALEIGRFDRSLAEVLATSGRAGLEALPAIGASVAHAIEGLLTRGDWQPLRDQSPPDRQLLTLPGVGPRLAELLRERMGITSLEQLRAAATAGRLAEAGVSRQRQAGILSAVEQRLRREEVPETPEDEPSVEDLLASDIEFRATQKEHFANGQFLAGDPEQERCVGVWKGERNGWKLRAHFANTALAHRMNRTRDWVTITFERGGLRGQRNVVTETQGDLTGNRVVRGRESECRSHTTGDLARTVSAA